MNQRERFLAVLNDQPYDRVPCLHYGYWLETVDKWEAEGHLPAGTAHAYRETRSRQLPDDTPLEREIDKLLGFDHNIHSIYMQAFPLNCGLYPFFEQKVIRTRPDGSEEVQNYEGVMMLKKYRSDGTAISAIQQHLAHTLTDRESWEAEYKPRLQFTEERFDYDELARLAKDSPNRDRVLGLHCGSLVGQLRNWIGFEELCYLPLEDEELFEEIIDTIGELHYRNVEAQLKTGVQFDYAHFWEDICGNDGPLMSPAIYRDVVGPHYRRITDLLRSYGVNIISLDCDGKVDALVDIWLDHGINTLFPLEYGKWHGSIGPFRQKHGSRVKGLGGMNKNVFAQDYAAVDAEIERLKPLVEMGGFIPSPDHRIPPEAKWENVQYYTEQFNKTFTR